MAPCRVATHPGCASVAEATDHAVQLELVAAGIGVALIPQLAARTVPNAVRLLRVHPPVHRHHFALSRRSARRDPGLSRIVELLKDNATHAVNEPSPAVATPSVAQAN